MEDATLVVSSPSTPFHFVCVLLTDLPFCPLTPPLTRSAFAFAPRRCDVTTQWCASSFADSLFAAYEMTSPHDAFGKMMQQNIQVNQGLTPGLTGCACSGASRW